LRYYVLVKPSPLLNSINRFSFSISSGILKTVFYVPEPEINSISLYMKGIT